MADVTTVNPDSQKAAVRLRTGRKYRIAFPSGPSLTVSWFPDLHDPYIFDDKLELCSDSGYRKTLPLDEATRVAIDRYDFTFKHIKPSGHYSCRVVRGTRPPDETAPNTILFEGLALQPA